jgi:cytochrome c553
MDTTTSAMSGEDMRDIAHYFAAQKLPRTPFRADPAKVVRGREMAEELKCASCHMTNYSGKDEVPRLAGLGGLSHGSAEEFPIR